MKLKEALLPQARAAGLVVSEVDKETLVYDLESNKAHCLNQTAALVWKRCDGKTSAGEMAELLQDQLGSSVSTDIVWLAVKQLKRFHLIEFNDIMSSPAPAVSRRELLLKYAPAALALPVIMSITIQASAQTSCLPVGASCNIDAQCCESNCNAGTCEPAL